MRRAWLSLGALALSAAPALASAATADDPAERGMHAEPATGNTRQAVTEGVADLLAAPPQREAARAALDHAISSGGDPRATAEAHFRLGALDEEDGAVAGALAHYRAIVDDRTGGRWARGARARVTWLEQRAEGGFAPLSRFLRMRRDTRRCNDADEVAAFAREAETFPPGLVRSASRMLAAEAWSNRLGHPDDARMELRRVLDDRSSDPTDARLAVGYLTRSLLAAGRIDEAASEVQRHPFDRAAAEEVGRLLRQRTLRRLLLAVMTGLAAGMLFLLIRRRGADPRPVRTGIGLRTNRPGVDGDPHLG
jgi:hypothetical protein